LKYRGAIGDFQGYAFSFSLKLLKICNLNFPQSALQLF